MRKDDLPPSSDVSRAGTGSEVGRDKSSRWDHVLTRLAATKRLSVAEVSRTLGISESTVRRDFMEMERAQLARRTHRSEERRVGKECRSGGAPEQQKQRRKKQKAERIECGDS